MKNIIKILAMFLFVTFQTVGFAQTATEKEELSTTLTKIFEISKTKDITPASGLLANAGDNEATSLKKALDFTNSEDLSNAKRLMRKIKSLIEISDSFTFDTITISTKKDITVYAYNVKFKSGAQTLTSVFGFVKIDNKMMLAYVD